jgi:hypothetical protein
MDEAVTPDRNAYMATKKQKVSRLNIVPRDLLTGPDLILGVAGQVDSETPENRPHQTGTVEPGRRNAAPEVRYPEKATGLAWYGRRRSILTLYTAEQGYCFRAKNQRGSVGQRTVRQPVPSSFAVQPGTVVEQVRGCRRTHLGRYYDGVD